MGWGGFVNAKSGRQQVLEGCRGLTYVTKALTGAKAFKSSSFEGCLSEKFAQGDYFGLSNDWYMTKPMKNSTAPIMPIIRYEVAWG